jgi:hypothetical protein
MTENAGDIFAAAQAQFQANDAELAFLRERQFVEVIRKSATGSANMDSTFSMDRHFRLVYLRCHFAGGSGTAPLAIALDSGLGSAYDAILFTVSAGGTGSDIHFRVGGSDAQEPSAWTFQSDDSLRVQWTNPDSGDMTWGLELGLVAVA